MIAKKVASAKGSSKGARAKGLLEYIDKPEKENNFEKCIHTFADGFLTDDLASQIAEMTALAEEAVRSADPINHYVLSWPEGETPTPDQVDEAVKIFMKELVLEGHQVFAGLHADTDNTHLHIAVNRVNPETLRPVQINNGFDIEAIHMAVAKIEHAQGWSREERGRYVVLDSGDVARDVPDTARLKQPHQSRIDVEVRTGEKSAERIAIEDAAPLIRSATSWAELHTSLAEQGIQYQKTGSGAKIFIGDVAVKASSADRSASLSQLEKRLGIYQPVAAQTPIHFIQHKVTAVAVPRAIQDPNNDLSLNDQSGRTGRLHVVHRLADQPGRRFSPTGGTPTLETASLHTLSERRLAGRQQIQGQGRETGHPNLLPPVERGDRRADAGLRRLDGARARLTPIRAVHPSAVEYLAAKGVAATAKRLATIELQTRHGAERLALLKQQQAKRADLFKGTSWRGAGAHRVALRSVLAGQQAADKADLQERHQLERAALRVLHPAFPEVKTWATRLDQANSVQVDPLADQWRQRGQTRPTITGERSVPPVVQDIRAYMARIVRGSVHYWAKGSSDRRIAFIDSGKQIAITQWSDPNALHAAAQLAAQKWPKGVTIDGPPEYIKAYVKLAAEHGFKVVNPELQGPILEAKAEHSKNRTTDVLAGARAQHGATKGKDMDKTLLSPRPAPGRDR